MIGCLAGFLFGTEIGEHQLKKTPCIWSKVCYGNANLLGGSIQCGIYVQRKEHNEITLDMHEAEHTSEIFYEEPLG